MAPKKAQKMSLNAFLGDSALGSWADEMDALPTAPSGNPEERSRLSDAPNRRDRDDFRSDRPPREDLPLPSAPPYTAFIGNLAFDVTESEIGVFFGSHQTKSVKIIKDREDKPKGFGYVEFAELEGLKDALTKTGSSFAGRTIRVSVAEPPKERGGTGGGGGFDDDAKFSGNWRREGPLPDLHDSRDSSRRRFEGERSQAPPGASDNAGDWRSTSRPPARGLSDSEPRVKRMGFGGGDTTPGAADTEETWSKGSKFKPSAAPEDGPGSRFGGGAPKHTNTPPDESDWRKPSRPMSRNSRESESTPPTPARRKLELLPKSASNSTVASPLSSPNPAIGSRSNPFGAAKPVDVSAKEAVIAERLEKDKDRLTHTMSRTSSRTGSERPSPRSMAPPADPPTSAGNAPGSPSASSPRFTGATVRPAFSFAAAAKKDAGGNDIVEAKGDASTVEVTRQLAETQI